LAAAKAEEDAKAKVAAVNRGLAYSAKKDYDRTIADYSEAIKLDPKYASAFYWRGKAKQMKGDASGGAADISKAKELDPTAGN
jgi:tetratricopeptide (TPR) repeat protein